MGKVALSIDGLDIVADKGTTILEAALHNGVYIPHLCHHPALKPSGICRLCVVEVGDGELVTSCRMLVEEGMAVKTSSQEADKVRRATVELIVANHHTNCRDCPSTGHCELQKIMAHLRLGVKRMRPLRWARERLPLEAFPPFDYDPNRCVLCEICVRTCEKGMLHLVGRGSETKIAFFGNGSACNSCQDCVPRCPVGALLPRG